MATYEYRCRACGATFEERRAMEAADAPAICPDGHPDTARLLSVFASTSTAGRGDPAPMTGGSGLGGGGCCGGACGCG